MRFFILAVLAAFSLSAHAQQPDSTTTYYSASDQKLPGREGAAYYKVTTMRDSVMGVVREYYPDGKRRAYTFFANMRRHKRDGTALEWYPNGQLKVSSRYLLGDRHGNTETWYADGKVRRTDLFQYGKLLGGHTYGPDGKETDYYPLEQMPEYPGGMAALMEQIMANTHYPREARKDNVQGKVMVRFAVNEQGSVDPASISVIRSAHALLDQAAVEAVRSLKTFTPGRYDGEPTRIWMVLPVSFRM